MPVVTLKLFATLGARLPPGAMANATQLPVDEGQSVHGLLSGYGLGEKECHLVLLNGVFVPPSLRASTVVADGDAVSVWPPVGGG